MNSIIFFFDFFFFSKSKCWFIGHLDFIEHARKRRVRMRFGVHHHRRNALQPQVNFCKKRAISVANFFFRHNARPRVPTRLPRTHSPRQTRSAQRHRPPRQSPSWTAAAWQWCCPFASGWKSCCCATTANKNSTSEKRKNEAGWRFFFFFFSYHVEELSSFGDLQQIKVLIGTRRIQFHAIPTRAGAFWKTANGAFFAYDSSCSILPWFLLWISSSSS